MGSDNLGDFVRAHRDRLRCDVVVISDSSMFAPGQPSILSSLRGLTYFQIDVDGPARDLHSGIYGGAGSTRRPRWPGSLRPSTMPDGRIAVPGFYDSVRDGGRVRKRCEGCRSTTRQFREETGAPALGGEPGYTVLERVWTRPTCEVNGLLSGYTGEGAKTVLPAMPWPRSAAGLVPDQEPVDDRALMQAHVERVAPTGVACE